MKRNNIFQTNQSPLAENLMFFIDAQNKQKTIALLEVAFSVLSRSSHFSFFLSPLFPLNLIQILVVLTIKLTIFVFHNLDLITDNFSVQLCQKPCL